MRRRLTLAIVGTVAAALLLTGIGTLFFTRLNAREQTEDEAREQAEAIASLLDLASQAVQGRMPLRDQVQAAGAALRVQEIELVVIDGDGRTLTERTTLPSGLAIADIDVDALREGDTVSGRERGFVFAAAPIAAISRAAPEGQNPSDATKPNGGQGLVGAVVITRDADELLGPSAWWFVRASIFSLLVGALVAAWLGRRFTEPLADARNATEQIARGELDARVPVYRDRGRELRELAESINTMAHNLQRSRGLEQQFLLSISHDLRTPLTSITGYAEAIADGAAPDDKRAAAVIQHEARRLERLMGDLLQLARLDAQSFRLERQTVELGSLAARSADGFRQGAAAEGLSIEVDVDPSVWVSVDPDRMAQVVANLTENALKYARQGIRVSVHPDGSDAVLAVADDGPGIADEDLPHVFERLYVARHQPVRRESGSGLGLAIVQELVAAMDGSVAARRADAGGTEMRVRLPLVTPPG